MNIEAIPALEDNYIWMIQEEKEVIIVDPGDFDAVMGVLEERDLELTAVLVTHNHEDHTAGIKKLKQMKPDLPVYGPPETAGDANHLVEEGDTLSIFEDSAQVYSTPGHTSGHISYLIDRHLFCGDALFSAGCGRVFTGDYEAQYRSLQWFKSLDDKTEIYPAHEYTSTNLSFAKEIAPYNKDIERALEEAEEKQDKGQPTLPSTIAREKKINLFLQAESLNEFIELRRLRDNF